MLAACIINADQQSLAPTHCCSVPNLNRRETDLQVLAVKLLYSFEMFNTIPFAPEQNSAKVLPKMM